jgi:hypothetical protein
MGKTETPLIGAPISRRFLPLNVVVAFALAITGCGRPAADTAPGSETAAAQKAAPRLTAPAAKAIYDKLRKLQAQAELGINLPDYSHAVSDVAGDLAVFNESAEAKICPELTALLANVTGCHVFLRSTWGATSNNLLSPYERFAIESAMIDAPKKVWGYTKRNLDLAREVFDRGEAALPEARKAIESDLPKTVEDAITADIGKARAKAGKF